MAEQTSAGSLDLEPKTVAAIGDQVLRRIVGLQERLPDRPARPTVAQAGDSPNQEEMPAEEPGARGRRTLAGMEDADSVTLDPHKSLFLPFGTGALVVRDRSALLAAYSDTGHYQQDYVDTDALPDYSRLGPELSREVRGVRVWLPLRLHGVAAFRAALDEKLDLAAAAHRALSAIPELELPTGVGLSTLTFRVRATSTGDAAVEQSERATRRLLDRIAAEGRFMLSSTTIDGQFVARICILAHRTHAEHIDELVVAITAAVKAIATDGDTALPSEPTGGVTW